CGASEQAGRPLALFRRQAWRLSLACHRPSAGEDSAALPGAFAGKTELPPRQSAAERAGTRFRPQLGAFAIPAGLVRLLRRDSGGPPRRRVMGRRSKQASRAGPTPRTDSDRLDEEIVP